jgi:hypothetical protein
VINEKNPGFEEGKFTDANTLKTATVNGKKISSCVILNNTVQCKEMQCITLGNCAPIPSSLNKLGQVLYIKLKQIDLTHSFE